MENRNGTIRQERLPKNLLHSTFKIDDRSIWDILGYISSFLKEINYYNLQNEPDESWHDLIKNDPVIFIVSIINEPFSELKKLVGEKEFDTTSLQNKLRIAELLLNEFNKVNSWFKILHEMGESRLANKIGNILNDLLIFEKRQLEKFISTQKDTSAQTEKAVSYLPQMLPPPPEDATELKFGKAVNIFFKGIYHIRETAQNHLLHTFMDRKGHAAHNALYLVFTVLFQKLSNRLNAQTKNHLDFYYQKVLKQEPDNGKQSLAVIIVELIPGVSNFLLEVGTKVSAGKINNSIQEYVFETQKPLLIQAAKIESLQTLYLNKNKYVKTGTRMPLISSVKHEFLINKERSTFKNRDTSYLFGADEHSTLATQIEKSEVGTLGFVISSSVLLLSEGVRHIDLSIKLVQKSATDILISLLNEIKEHRKKDINFIFDEIFSKAFKISYSSLKGWITLPNYEVFFDFNTCELCFKLLVKITQPAVAITKNNKEQLRWPAIKIELNEYAPVYVYSFLEGIEVEVINIDVSVSELKNLSIYNNIGKIAPAKTFDLFGPIPEARSWILLGKSELFQKEVTSLTINIDWNNLPTDPGGFENYYHQYAEEISNDTFKVDFSMLSRGYWLQSQEKDHYNTSLFETEPSLTRSGVETVQLKNRSTLHFDGISDLGVVSDSNLKDPLLYTVHSDTGFVRLMLTAPSYGFGQELYQEEFTSIAVYNAQNKENLPYPKKPFIPKVNKINMGYEASDSLYFSAQHASAEKQKKGDHDFFHMTPFGWNQPFNEFTTGSIDILPAYKAEGYLFMSLSEVSVMEPISLYFDLNTVANQNRIKSNNLRFEYLEFENWKPISNKNILQDHTGGLTKSGILEVLLPEVSGYKKENHKNYKLRIVALDNAANYPLLKGVYVNAVEVKGIITDKNLRGLELSPGNINKLVGKYPTIQKVYQPVATFGGKPEENEAQFYTRVSERLRHKGRAVSTWDYERLILEQFTEVKAVKCTNLDGNFKPTHGHVRIIVLPTSWRPNYRSFFNQNMLERMQQYLKKLASASVTIEMMNPQIEYLLVRGEIEYQKDEDGSYFEKQIHEDINAFLSPVYNMKDSYEGIGGVVVPNTVTGFVEDLSYVKSVKKLAIEHIIQKGVNRFSLGIFNLGQEIEPSTPSSVLVPCKWHHLENIYQIKDHIDITNPGIGALEIGTDFILGEPYHELVSLETNSRSKEGKKKKDTNNAILVQRTKKNEK